MIEARSSGMLLILRKPVVRIDKLFDAYAISLYTA